MGQGKAAAFTPVRELAMQGMARTFADVAVIVAPSDDSRVLMTSLR